MILQMDIPNGEES